MELAHKQLKELRPDLNDRQVYEATGLILMNGHTDQAFELYTVDVFERLVQYANEKVLGRVSFWALNRDRPCGDIKTGWVSGLCSSLTQKPYDFCRALAKFRSNTTIGTTIATTVSTTHPPTQPSTQQTSQPTNQPTNPSTQTISVSTEESSATTSNGTTTHVTFSPVIDDVDCRHQPDNSHFPYKEDCTEYIRCYNRLAHLEHCAEGTIYDTKLHICNWPTVVDRPECK